ncbi:MAG: hypothetical protein NVS9B12_00880 [Vulcanimicrobiaceae bacterium]
MGGTRESTQKAHAPVSSDDRGAAQQRQFYRAPVDFPASLHLAGGEPAIARAQDLSGAGIRISTEGTLDRGQTVELRFRLPGGTAELTAHGFVVLSFFEGASQRYHHGIAFTRISAGDREAIVHYIHDVQRRTLKS